jgi:acetyl-CoA carboxylase carboxyltransferase component
VARLLDPGIPFLELSTLAGWRQDVDDVERSVPGGGTICGIGVVSGVRVLVVADDAGIDAGALQAQGLEKLLRAQQIALENRCRSFTSSSRRARTCSSTAWSSSCAAARSSATWRAFPPPACR